MEHGRPWSQPPVRLLLLLYVLFLYGISAFYFFQWPIVAGDTDLWYHLNGGRYIAEHRALPTDSSFISFITPARAWIDYYWLFEALVYQTFQAFQYPGLIVFRNLLYFATLTVILMFLLQAYRRTPGGARLYLLCLFLMYMFFLFSRYILVRPHMFSYLFLVMFLLVFEFFPQRSLWLLPVAVLWYNLHGAEYPVPLLISGAYLLEFFVNRLRGNRSPTGSDLAFLIPAALSMWAVLATPHGAKLLPVPFSVAYASDFVAEYRHLTLESLVTAHVTMFTLTQGTLFNLLLFGAWANVIAAGVRKRFKLSHLILLLGGTVLLLKGVRFTYECVLLALPALASNHLFRRSGTEPKIAAPRAIIVGALLILTPIMSVRAQFINPPRFPFSPRGLPEGVVTFLSRIQVPGPVLNAPDSGGYLQWKLGPTRKIFMDMQCPLLFIEADLHTGVSMFVHEQVLKNVLATYDPSFITVPIARVNFRELSRAIPEYTLVFFDDAEVLYVNRQHHPTIAARFAVQALDPFTLARDGPASALSGGDRQALVAEARKLLEIYPDSLLVNQFVAFSFNEEGAFDRALPFAEAIIRNFPEARTGYGMKADALQGLKRFEEALAAYRIALRKSSDEHHAEIYRAMGLAYRGLGRRAQAFRAFKRGINPFSSRARSEEIYWLASSALESGRVREAALFLRFAAEKVSPEDPVWYQRLKELERAVAAIRSP